ncbi:pyridoxamine 5'-phosphate oxidase family protein [Eubacterium sp. An3]|uniref:pyridoxamine 5'-phosphate oxidase family protein n=1 Tax=Eubacterium sp. An3 TaxID=1965628 RepID=UPI000B37619B|nr:pyridoxamine 5'-phosphate oxidase family protein [Eubacterium sp. An3]OUO28268.1 5-nitroimidazole antibiotic resistance protein [Eubacterium sp. An3]
MFREMRRKKQQLTQEETMVILRERTSGVLSLTGDEGYPYGVPLSYVYDGDKLYFHCAKEGHKIDAIRKNPKASFCVIAQDEIVPEKYTTCYRSVIAFGSVRILENEGEKRRAIEELALKYAPEDSEENRQNYIEKDWEPLCMLEMTVEHLSGKEAIELVRRKQK